MWGKWITVVIIWRFDISYNVINLIKVRLNLKLKYSTQSVSICCTKLITLSVHMGLAQTFWVSTCCISTWASTAVCRLQCTLHVKMTYRLQFLNGPSFSNPAYQCPYLSYLPSVMKHIRKVFCHYCMSAKVSIYMFLKELMDLILSVTAATKLVHRC